MSEFDAIGSLLASLTPHKELFDSEVRRTLREQAGLSKAQVARAPGVSSSTVTGWETGRDPAGETRATYACLLDGLAARFAPPAEPEPDYAALAMPAAPAAAAAPAMPALRPVLLTGRRLSPRRCPLCRPISPTPRCVPAS
ncbi:helix-turn-helix domain-containing protein [Streptomyces sp. NPDC055140]